jgi:hypothetical protein
MTEYTRNGIVGAAVLGGLLGLLGYITLRIAGFL